MTKNYNIKSMTGFGRSQYDTPRGQYVVELRSVNNRFLDLSLSLPREMNFLEANLRRLFKDVIDRGKVDCRVRFTTAPGQQPVVSINQELAARYIEALRGLQAAGAGGDTIPLDVLTGFPGVVEITSAELDDEQLWAELEGALRPAIENLNAERAREGQALAGQLHDLGQRVTELVGCIEAVKDQVVVRYRERLGARIAELEDDTRGKLEPGRLEVEVALYADRCDLSEELVRLRVHLDRLETLLANEKGESVGKNLDFLVQEFGREINTICSKARDTDITGHALEMKNCVESMREQIQNIQ